MQRARFAGAAILVAVATYGARAQAQTTVGADLGLFSSYVWRGLSLTNKPVAQPDIYVTIPAGNASLAAGGWSNIDLGQYNDASSDISESGGASTFNLSELDWWGEVSYPLGKVRLTGGVLGYVYPNDAEATGVGLFTKKNNTVEIYGKAAVDNPLSPKISAYYDVDKIKGLYLEGSLGYSFAASDKVSISLGALAGFNAGQSVPDDPASGELFSYSDDGFTHLDLSAGVPFTAGAVSITPVLHFVVAGDDFVKITSPTKSDADVKLWGGVSLAWSRQLGVAPSTDQP
jgi:uncharacterized protein Gcw-chp